ncbi:MAG: hypothetical protein KGN84_21630 [Acidobacteriota bacterium]|nr:hypothetical protein [Acidobacteriota bacterium]
MRVSSGEIAPSGAARRDFRNQTSHHFFSVRALSGIERCRAFSNRILEL